MTEFAPIIIFGYNRPDHFKQTIEALSKNKYAINTDLYLFCDGVKRNAKHEQQDLISEVGLVADKASGFKSIVVRKSEHNKGLANSIIDGVTEVIEKYGKVIILEDDLITSPYFIKYMNEALNYYENRKSVFSISANRPSTAKMNIPEDYPYDVFVSLRNYSTGWATWRDRWKQVDWSMDYMTEFTSNPQLVKAYNRGGEDLTGMMLMQQNGQIDSWAVRFGFAHFYNHAVAILPCVSYIDNIGFDGTGIHSGVNMTNTYRNDLSLAVENPKFLDYIYQDDRIINSFYSVFYPKKRPLWQKAINFTARKLGLKPPFVIKKKIYN